MFTESGILLRDCTFLFTGGTIYFIYRDATLFTEGIIFLQGCHLVYKVRHLDYRERHLVYKRGAILFTGGPSCLPAGVRSNSVGSISLETPDNATTDKHTREQNSSHQTKYEKQAHHSNLSRRRLSLKKNFNYIDRDVYNKFISKARNSTLLCSKCRTLLILSRTVSVQVQLVSYKFQQGHKLFGSQCQTNRLDLIGSECHKGTHA